MPSSACKKKGHSETCIAPLLLGGILAAGASSAGNAIGAAPQSQPIDTSKEIAEMNNKFNAEQAQLQRDWQEKMWNKNNEYNSPQAMISRGLNPFIGSSVGAGVSKSPASGGAAASAASPPSLQAFRPDFSDVGSALASMAQARASMMNAEQNAALTPYRINQILGDTNYRNIGVGQSGYWNFFFFKQKTAYDITVWLEFRRVLFRSIDRKFARVIVGLSIY